MAARGDNIAAIGAALDAPADAPEFTAPDDLPYDGRGDDGAYDAPLLPPDCPITPLGMLSQRCWYLDSLGQIIDLEAGQRHGINSLNALFGRHSGWLWEKFPRWSEEKRNKAGEVVREAEIVGFKQDAASRALIEACAIKGIFDPAGRIRGAGAHRGSGDSLVIHCGNTVMRRCLRLNGEPDDIEYHPMGVHGRHVYPAAPPIPRPWPEYVGADAAAALLGLVRGWHWQRELIDPLIVLGGIGCSLIGGALDWRPNIWITGGKGTGKSTLNGKRGLLDLMMGAGQLRSADTTAAGVRQRLRNSTVPVFLDELEAEEDGRRTKSIIELARVSSSGDDAHRGGQDHQAMEFTLQSVFWASSILIPAMQPADKSRWAICELRPIPEGARKPNLRAARLPEMGQKMMRRMVDGWWRWADTLEAYQDALSAMGHKARACDQFGTLLAAADILLHDRLDLTTVDHVASLCEPSALREVADASEEHELCLTHLRTTMVQARGGDERESIGTWIGEAVQEIAANDPMVAAKYHKRLQELGLKLVHRSDKGGAPAWEPGKRAYLAVANSHQALAGVFAGKTWQNGVWAQALARCPDAVESVTTKFARSAMRATLVPLEQVIDESEVPASARWGRAA